MQRTEEERFRKTMACSSRVTLLLMSLRMKSLTKDTSSVPCQLLNSWSECIRTTSEFIDTPLAPDASLDCEKHQCKLDWSILHSLSTPSPTLRPHMNPAQLINVKTFSGGKDVMRNHQDATCATRWVSSHLPNSETADFSLPVSCLTETSHPSFPPELLTAITTITPSP